MYAQVIDNTSPFAAWFYGLCDLIFGRNLTARHITAFFILFFQSGFIGIVFIDKRAFNENTFIPSFIFSLLTLISFDFLSLTLDLAAFGFLLLALNALLTEIEFRVQKDDTILTIGIMVGIASLFNFSYSIYLLGILLLLIIFTRNTIRKYALMVVGFLLPHALLMCGYLLANSFSELWNQYYTTNLTFSYQSLISAKSLLVLGAVPLVFLFLALIVVNRSVHLTKYQSQVMQTMLFWIVIATIQIIFTSDLRPQSLLPLLPTVSFFITHFLLTVRRRKFGEISVIVLATGIIATLYGSRYEKISTVNYARLYPEIMNSSIIDKRVLVLEDSPGIYLYNTIAPAFINWGLTEEIFKNPNYYENVLLVNRLFENDPPELIVDKNNLMESYFNRIPALRNRYTKFGDNTWVLINN